MDFEGDLSVYFIYKWYKKESLDFLQKNGKYFIDQYIKLGKKYGIAAPINSVEYTGLDSELFFSLYNIEGDYYYPSVLFLDENAENPEKIISVNPILTLAECKLKESSHGSIPFRVELFNRPSETELVCYLDNDIFNSWIDNNRTKLDPEIGKKGFWVDSSGLAYLNAPRLNSYLRDLKHLCNECKMDHFDFENLGLEDFSGDGLLFGDEIVYYEDICEMLEPRHQIVKP